MYLTDKAIDWTWLDNRAATCLTASILERKDCIRDRQTDLERLLKLSTSWKRRTAYREEVEHLIGGYRELSKLQKHVIQCHNANSCDETTGNGQPFNYGGTNGK